MSHRLLPTSLSARLVATVVALVRWSPLLVAAVTALAMKSTARHSQLDTQVDEALGRASGRRRVGLPALPPAVPARRAGRRRHEHGAAASGRPPAPNAAVWGVRAAPAR